MHAYESLDFVIGAGAMSILSQGMSGPPIKIAQIALNVLESGQSSGRHCHSSGSCSNLSVPAWPGFCFVESSPLHRHIWKLAQSFAATFLLESCPGTIQEARPFFCLAVLPCGARTQCSCRCVMHWSICSSSLCCCFSAPCVSCIILICQFHWSPHASFSIKKRLGVN